MLDIGHPSESMNQRLPASPTWAVQGGTLQETGSKPSNLEVLGRQQAVRGDGAPDQRQRCAGSQKEAHTGSSPGEGDVDALRDDIQALQRCLVGRDVRGTRWRLQ